MSDAEERSLARDAGDGDACARRELAERALRAGRGWLLVWAADDEHELLDGEIHVAVGAGRDGSGPTVEGSAVWAGSSEELWSRLGELRGRNALFVSLESGSAYQVGGRRVDLTVVREERLPASVDVPPPAISPAAQNPLGAIFSGTGAAGARTADAFLDAIRPGREAKTPAGDLVAAVLEALKDIGASREDPISSATRIVRVAREVVGGPLAERVVEAVQLTKGMPG